MMNVGGIHLLGTIVVLPTRHIPSVTMSFIISVTAGRVSPLLSKIYEYYKELAELVMKILEGVDEVKAIRLEANTTPGLAITRLCFNV